METIAHNAYGTKLTILLVQFQERVWLATAEEPRAVGNLLTSISSQVREWASMKNEMKDIHCCIQQILDREI
jgi:hypothetical protein